jgi:hypothetical protein
MSNGPSPDNLPTWITAGIVSIVFGLASTVAGIFKLMRDDAAAQVKAHDIAIKELRAEAATDRASAKAEMEALQAKATECQRDREDLRVQIARLESVVTANRKISDANHEADKS